MTGDAPTEIAPEIVVKPKDMHIVKGEAAVDLQCLANARYVYKYAVYRIVRLGPSTSKFSLYENADVYSRSQ